jgi:chromosome segregation ATPase
MDDLDRRLEKALERRSELAASIQKIEGKLEAATATLARLEEECRSKGVEPDQLDETIEKLEERQQQMVETIEQEIQGAEEALRPFVEEA